MSRFIENINKIIFKEQKIKIFHGDNYGTNKLEPKLMFQSHGNNQEGVGIYFGSLDTARQYGKYIISIEIDTKNFLPSREIVGDYINQQKIVKILEDLYKSDKEAMYYLITDYIEILEPEDINKYNLIEFASYLKNEENRNFQITLAQAFGVEEFVKAWNKYLPNIHGLYEKIAGFYCVINTDYKVNKETI